MNTAHGKPRIVVGVDESPASLAALRWAAREAGLRATRLQVVQAWERARWRVAPYASCVRLRGPDEDRAEAGARLEGAVRTMLGQASAIPVTVEVAEGLATQVLLDRPNCWYSAASPLPGGTRSARWRATASGIRPARSWSSAGRGLTSPCPSDRTARADRVQAGGAPATKMQKGWPAGSA